MKIKLIFFSALALLASCHEHTPEQPVYDIALDKTEIAFENSGGNATVKLTGYGKWSAGEFPDWIAMDRTSGDGATTITITSKANNEPDGRRAEIVFVNEDDKNKSATLTLSQAVGKKELEWSQLGFSTFDNVEYKLDANGVGRLYDFKVDELFVNPAMKEKVFMGNLVDRNLKVNTDLVEYKGYSCLPITLFPSTILSVKSATFSPSFAAQQAYAEEIIAAKPKQSERFYYNSGGVEFGSHRELNLIGRSNMGVALDEVVSGKSYREQEMAKKNGVIFSFSHKMFTLLMDNPEQLVKESLEPGDFPIETLSYISTVSYGRVGMLIVETDNSLSKVKAVVRTLLQNDAPTLTAEETALIGEIEAWHVYYDASLKLQADKGKAEIITAFKTHVEEDIHNAYPFLFTVANAFDSSMEAMSFKVSLP
jgi:hypothetical protein